jgi:oligoribonuclease (3'-5' exoribonuclease)
MNKEKSKNLLFLDVEATGLTEEDRLVQVAYDFEGTEKEAMLWVMCEYWLLYLRGCMTK